MNINVAKWFLMGRYPLRSFLIDTRSLLGSVLALVMISVAAMLFSTPQQSTAADATPPVVRPQPPGSTYYLLSSPQTGERLFGLQSVHSVVNSAYWYEANLLNGQIPTGDIDFILPYAAQELVHLPGFTSDHYRYLGVAYVYGSGWLSKWQTPTGGNFAFLHLQRPFTSTIGAPYIIPKHAPALDKIRYEDYTARAVGDQSTIPDGQNVPGNSLVGYFAGQGAVGISGWPTDPAYGNGYAGPGNSQLCLLLSARAADFFYSIATGQHRAPRPHPKPVAHFPTTRWLRAISAHNRAHPHHRWAPVPHTYHGSITHIARLWWHKYDHQCGGVTSPERWDGKQRYSRQTFTKCSAYHWSQYRGDPVKFVRSR